MKVWAERKELDIVHFYNPCTRLEFKRRTGIEGQGEGAIIWCGDFTGRSTAWGSDRTDHNGQIIEYMAEKNLVCQNNTGTNMKMGKESVLD